MARWGPVDHYRTLGIDRQANQEEVARAFRDLVRRTHPDVDPSPAATARLLDVIEAGEVLRHPERRQRYDAGLARAVRSTDPPHLYRHASLVGQLMTALLVHLARRLAVASRRPSHSGRVR